MVVAWGAYRRYFPSLWKKKPWPAPGVGAVGAGVAGKGSRAKDEEVGSGSDDDGEEGVSEGYERVGDDVVEEEGRRGNGQRLR